MWWKCPYSLVIIVTKGSFCIFKTFLKVYTFSSKCGKSRSAAIAIAYIMTCTNLTCEEAIASVIGARRRVKVNCSFLLQLKLFEAIRLYEVIKLKLI